MEAAPIMRDRFEKIQNLQVEKTLLSKKAFDFQVAYILSIQ